MVFVIPSQTLFQERTPAGMMGRVLSFRFSVVFGSMTLAMAISGLLGEAIGVQGVFVAFGLRSRPSPGSPGRQPRASRARDPATATRAGRPRLHSRLGTRARVGAVRACRKIRRRRRGDRRMTEREDRAPDELPGDEPAADEALEEALDEAADEQDELEDEADAADGSGGRRRRPGAAKRATKRAPARDGRRTCRRPRKWPSTSTTAPPRPS